MSEVPRQLLEHLKASVLRNIIIIVLNMTIEIFLKLGDFQVMVTLIVRVHFDPVIPVELADAHSDMSFPVSEGSVDLRFGSIEVEVWKRSR